jgi:hypothetical protein
MTTRRRFIESAAANAAALAIVPSSLMAALPADIASADSSAEWDVSWAERMKGRHKAVFDMTEPESGYGVWRAAIWGNQYTDVLKAAPADLSTVLILRHNAIAFAMNQGYWDRYNTGEMKKITHPLTSEITKKNPALLDERDGVPAPYSGMALHKQIGRGAIVLACNLAFRDCVETVKSVDKLSEEVARQRALGYLVPGVVLQPSGVFAVIRAQQAGAAYIKAS